MYTRLRDRYLDHVAKCRKCRRFWTSYWDDDIEEQVEYWTVWQPCAARTELLHKIEVLF